MKKWWILVPMALLLTGCSQPTEQVYETVGPIEYEPVAEAEPQYISVWTPSDAAVETLAGEDGGTLYSWSDCELRVTTVDAGDIQHTLETITGLDYDSLTVMNYRKDDTQYYETVWTTSSEDGIYIGRALVADDGNFHYCLSLTSPEGSNTTDVYAEICGSFALSETDEEK